VTFLNAHEIDYKIYGGDMQFVEIELDPSESVVAEAGGMMMMDDGIDMETIFGDGSEQKGLMSRLVGAGKRVITGESLFMTVFTNKAGGKKQVSFAAPYPGKIIHVDLKEMQGKVVCQKDAFLCAAKACLSELIFRKS
jgi:uncharacterized protein (AIM24 family)